MSAFTDAFKLYTEDMHVAPGAARGCPDCMSEPDVAVTCQSCGNSETHSMPDLMAGYDTLIVCCTDFKLETDGYMTDEEYSDLANESHFSSSQCEGCGSTLGGDRHPAHISHPRHISLHQWDHIEVCTDCLMYIANGDEPEEGVWR